jgi:hypothetical protein
MNTHLSDDEDAKSVADQAEWNHNKHQSGPFPRCPQEYMTGQQSGDE